MLSKTIYQAGAILIIHILAQAQAARNDKENKLELVQVLFREGERTPRADEGYPTDPYASAEYYRPLGRGQLIEAGRSSLRRLGIALRNRYDKFLGRDYSQRDVYAYSLDRDGCKSSLQFLIKYVYGMQDTTKIRLNSLPRQADWLMNSRACFNYTRKFDKVRADPEVQKSYERFQGLYEYLSEKTGLKVNKIAPDQTLYELYSLLECQRGMNLSMPNWCTEGVYNLLSDLAYIHYNLASFTYELCRMNGGPLVLRFFENVIQANSPLASARLHLYSGEGHNVAGFLRALNKRIPHVPRFGSAVVLEKRRDLKTYQVFVNLLVWSGGQNKFMPVQISVCPEFCPLEIFANIIQPILPSHRELQCLVEDPDDSATNGIPQH